MRQVLFFIPIKSIADSLPNIPVFVAPVVLVLALALGRWRRYPKVFFTVSYIVSGLLLLPFVLQWLSPVTEAIPIYGYGAMLFFAFVFCVLLAARLGLREGIEPKHVQDLAIWIFIFGIIGARVTHMIQFKEPLWKFFMIWEGGLEFYSGPITAPASHSPPHFSVPRTYL